MTPVGPAGRASCYLELRKDGRSQRGALANNLRANAADWLRPFMAGQCFLACAPSSVAGKCREQGENLLPPLRGRVNRALTILPAISRSRKTHKRAPSVSARQFRCVRVCPRCLLLLFFSFDLACASRAPHVHHRQRSGRLRHQPLPRLPATNAGRPPPTPIASRTSSLSATSGYRKVSPRRHHRRHPDRPQPDGLPATHE